MFIAIIGTPSAGKRTVVEYLLQKHEFQEIHLERPSDPLDATQLVDDGTRGLIEGMSGTTLSTPALTPSTASPLPTPPLQISSGQTSFQSSSSMLDHTTRNWQSPLVTTSLHTWAEIQPFLKRPSFLLVYVDGPLLTRYARQQSVKGDLTLESFIRTDDLLHHGAGASTSHAMTDFRRLKNEAMVEVSNGFDTVDGLWKCLDEINLVDEERLRPGWDTYFMTLASLASHRSNCMKRRVGALLVRSKRILSTGYNGTAKGTTNCNHGGCARCNGSARGGEALNECLCLHAEENALLEAGRDRIGEDSIIYCNTCPCLRCSVKIVQCGVREVVYNQSYSMDEASARVLSEAGVILRQLHLPSRLSA